jgi:methyl-accepting chemotaxis protein
MFSRMTLNTKLVGSVLASGAMALILALAAYSGLDTSLKQLQILFGQSQKQRLAAMLNSDFQLCISKAKNVAILKDEKNRAKVLKHFKDAQDHFTQLQPLADSDEEKATFDKLGASLQAVEPRLQGLLATAKSGDKADALYHAYLEGITEQYDAAVGSYVTALDEKVRQELEEKIRSTKLALGLSLGLVLLGLGLNLAVALGVSRNLKEAISSLKDGVGQLTSGASQVANTSQQLAEGASESASSLEETSASMEELASMTRQNSESAGQAQQLSKDAQVLIGKGNESVEKTLDSMREMNESAQEVSKIIKTIEEIAFQTNLLALNAAVEAARAGEHGRGFAVVAEEVRNLASRSAAAAKDTASMLEENARRAETGMGVSQAAGRSLLEIVSSSAKVAELVSAITLASGEQSRGLGEINNAISQMDKVTQNVTASAEELSSASEEMAGQADSLSALVASLVALVEGGHASIRSAA